jgi:hypothetical protein
VYTVDRGAIVAAPLVLVHQQVARRHHVVRLRFADGSSIEISAPHPTADGRRLGQLRTGDELGGKQISDVRIVPYEFERTYDILPASDTGTYFAGGALIGSTLGGSANEAAKRADSRREGRTNLQNHLQGFRPLDGRSCSAARKPAALLGRLVAQALCVATGARRKNEAAKRSIVRVAAADGGWR